jgi:fluoride exporter
MGRPAAADPAAASRGLVTPPHLRVALLAASAGGVVGALARWRLGEQFPVGDGFPMTVFWINVTGSALLAALPGVAVVRRTPWLAVFLGTGVLGGFTTFSSLAVDTAVLLDGHRTVEALAYGLGSVLAGVAAAALGARAGRRR